MTKLKKLQYILENANIEGLCEPEYTELMEWLGRINVARYEEAPRNTFISILNEETINGAIWAE